MCAKYPSGSWWSCGGQECPRFHSYEMCILVASEDNKHIHFRQLYTVIRKVNRHCDSNYWLFSCSVVSNLMDCRPPGSSVYGISQTRILEWVAIPFSRGSSCPGCPGLQADSLTLSYQGSSERKGMGDLGEVYLRRCFWETTCRFPWTLCSCESGLALTYG